MNKITEQQEQNDNQLNYYGDTIRAVRNEAYERAAKIADSYRTIESRAIAQDIRSLKC